MYPRATQEIPKILEMIETLIGKGFAYAVNGDVYFRVQAYEGYGKLSNRSLDSLIAGARVDVDESKEHPADFALWKSQKPGEPSWESPWGQGRPGWHIECSAMSIGYLGETIDIHGGGRDLVYSLTMRTSSLNLRHSATSGPSPDSGCTTAPSGSEPTR